MYQLFSCNTKYTNKLSYKLVCAKKKQASFTCTINMENLLCLFKMKIKGSNINQQLIKYKTPKHYTLVKEWKQKPSLQQIKETLPEYFI